MNYFTLILIGAFFCAFIFFEIKFLKARNYYAFFLSIPYIFALLILSSLIIRSEIQARIKRVEISEMRLLENLNLNETTAITLNSQARFGDGFQCAGGLILVDHDEALLKILASKGIIRPEGKSAIWLLDSKASIYTIQNDLLFAVNQEQAEKGIWIGWIDTDMVKNIKNMDGSNL